ncbi:sulfurtransferase [Hydrogenophaga sp.]|uniref:sulfurtransferase n=1 Tax=Hydrogenophaga sp. TaxID=1904254 RepID=UPI0027259086|nr:rhodanese-like domain-containing protein [Hydrogenophaga sp.]MDO9435059.1 rhodanese-like domain-containing protein [Hydrogenophaga sp.]
MKKSLQIVLISLLGWLLALPHAFAQTPQGQLVSAQWLKDQLSKKQPIVLLDASPTKLFLAKHIEGAVSVSFTQEESTSQGVNLSYGGGIDYLTDSEQQPFAFQDRPVPEIEALFRSWGVSNNAKVVIYDQGGAMHATRLFFSFAYHGFPLKNVHILNGGLSKWEELKLPVTTAATPAPKAGNFKVARLQQQIKTNTSEVLAASGDPQKNALVEALDASWHFGSALNYSRRGHIPNAIMAPAADFYNADKTFKSPEDIKRMLTHLGIKPEQHVFTHCGGGIAGSVAFFAIKHIAQYPNVKHYTESQLGWLHDERNLPFWTYDDPNILRDAGWLQWWGGQRTRSLGSIHVSVVDVRNAAAYNERHVPFALNVPADEFRKNLRNPQALIATLGAAGVNPSHEAVLLSGNGISKESALAFVALEALGQKKVSILTDSLDSWAGQGYALRDKPTVVADKKVPFDLAVPPVKFTAQPRADVLISDRERSNGLYPKVFLASGAALPSAALQGKVIHVPYTALVNEDGTPKEAAAIWDTLSKAGVSRYAELVTVSDDPSEAAVNYVVLKLMGFPNIKTLAL